MKNSKLIFAQAALVLGLAGTFVIAGGQEASIYDLSWNTIDAGGGTSTGGAYSLSGTIGQHDAGGPLTGGAYTLEGGFWPGNAPVITCPADINGDHTVSVADLLAVITGWGSCPIPCPPHCAADIAPTGGDCAVNVSDLLKVITAWGACP